MSASSPAPGFSQALRWWCKLGWTSFGGPAGQIALMHQEVVERRGWIDEASFLRALNYCLLLPGPEAQQLATYIGWRLHGLRGGLAAGLLFILPAWLLMLLLSWLYVAFADLPALDPVLAGLRPAVVALIAAAAWRLGQRLLRRPAQWLIAAAAFIALNMLALPFPLTVLLAALAGTRFLRERHGQMPAPAPASGKSRRWRLPLALLIVALALAALAYWLLPPGPMRTMAAFFTQTALLTFGGAYAVLPHVDAVAVRHGWLAPGQMLDGLALSESTPGPLIMVVSFVGFVGGWQAAGSGDETLALAVLGATIATFFTFLPSFLLVFLGAPLIESGSVHARLAAPLAGINAAVIGVIVHLALTFARTTFWPEGHFSPFSLLLALAALLALLRWRIGPVTLMAACVLLALARPLLLPAGTL